MGDGAGLAGLGPLGGRVVNEGLPLWKGHRIPGLSDVKAPFKGKVDQELLDALGRLNTTVTQTGGAPMLGEAVSVVMLFMPNQPATASGNSSSTHT